MSDSLIHVVEEQTGDLKTTGREITVFGGEVADALGRLAREATVRKITLKTQSGRTLAEIPLVLGAAGVVLIGPWTAALLAAAWLGRVSILIEYEETA